MATKLWKDLTLEEKVEELRNDLERTMATLNSLSRDQHEMRGDANSLRVELNRLADRLAQMEKKAPNKE